MLVIEMFVKLNEHWHQQVFFQTARVWMLPNKGYGLVGSPKKNNSWSYFEKNAQKPHDIRRPVPVASKRSSSTAISRGMPLLSFSFSSSISISWPQKGAPCRTKMWLFLATNLCGLNQHVVTNQKHFFNVASILAWIKNWFHQLKCGLNQQNCWLNQSEIVFTHKNWDFINKNWIELIEPTNSGFREQKCDWNQQKMIQPTQVKF